MTGSISFVEVYEPIGNPEPVPPLAEIAKPDEKLPQTKNSETNQGGWTCQKTEKDGLSPY